MHKRNLGHFNHEKEFEDPHEETLSSAMAEFSPASQSHTIQSEDLADWNEVPMCTGRIAIESRHPIRPHLEFDPEDSQIH